MESIKKLEKLAPLVQNGALAFFSSKLPIGELISECDNHARFTHCGIVLKSGTHLMLIHSQPFIGVHPSFLSAVVKSHCDIAFLNIKRSCGMIDKALDKTRTFAETGLKYDMRDGIKEMLHRKFGWNMKWLGKGSGYYCSKFAQLYTEQLGLIEYRRDEIFPQDFLRLQTNLNTEYVG